MTTASADFSPCFKLKKKKRPLPAMFRTQRLHAGAEVDADAIERIVDEEVDRLLEGGPGSGRYPAGSGKDPNAGGNGKVQWHQPWDESKRDSPKVDYDKTVREIRKIKQKISILNAKKEIADLKSKVADIDAKEAKVKELADKIKELSGQVADAHRRGEEAKAKAEEHKANRDALRAEYKRRWGKDLK